jgi:hypothetical protein
MQNKCVAVVLYNPKPPQKLLKNKAKLGTGHYLCWGVAPKRNVFRGKNFVDPTIKKSKI